ncbi:MAG: glycine cleavage system aminomethyltransferase GcvT, partial [bacterium]
MAEKTPLYNWHVARRAKMVEFNGWFMPLFFTSMTEEHRTVREFAGLFDLCHMGRLRVSGGDAGKLLEYVLTNEVEDMKEGQVRYALICNEQGGVIDDVTVYKEFDRYLLVVNAGNRLNVVDWLNRQKREFQAKVEDLTPSLSMCAIQGPLAEEIINKVTDRPVSDLPYYSFTTRQVMGNKTIISRTGYTGEDGFEIYCTTIYISQVWEKLMEVGGPLGLKPIGLGARDSLRLEACMPLWGHELHLETTPVNAGLERFVSLKKTNFVGMTRMIHLTPSPESKRLVAFELLERGVPRKDMAIERKGINIGEVTSGIFSPTLQRGIGLAYVEQQYSMVGSEMNVIIRNKKVPAR